MVDPRAAGTFNARRTQGSESLRRDARNSQAPRLHLASDRDPGRPRPRRGRVGGDDYILGIVQSHAHELWARKTGTQLREAGSGFRYTPTTTFETFPFPRPTDEQRERVGEAARRLVELRDGWLNPPGLDPADLEKRTLTNLYNQRPTWLDHARSNLDVAFYTAPTVGEPTYRRNPQRPFRPSATVQLKCRTFAVAIHPEADAAYFFHPCSAARMDWKRETLTYVRPRTPECHSGVAAQTYTAERFGRAASSGGTSGRQTDAVLTARDENQQIGKFRNQWTKRSHSSVQGRGRAAGLITPTQTGDPDQASSNRSVSGILADPGRGSCCRLNRRLPRTQNRPQWRFSL